MYYSALSDSFEYLCYVSTDIINMLTLSVRGPSLYVTYRDGPRTERVKVKQTVTPADTG